MDNSETSDSIEGIAIIAVTPDKLPYVIYTYGSTGKPKAVVI